MNWNPILVLLTAFSLNQAPLVVPSPASVVLSWTAPGDDGMVGTASQYDLRYSTALITESNFAAANRWTSVPVPTVAGTTQSATITGLVSGTTYYFVIKAADEVPNWSAMSNLVVFTPLASDTRPPARISNLRIGQ